MRAALWCLLLACLPCALAERWTIQVFAYAQAERAQAVADQLRGFGYDAYTDTLPGGSLTQVRIGCFGGSADAGALAADVRQRVTLDAFVAPFQAGAAATVCADREPGFLAPAAWGLETRSASAVTFWLEAAGRRSITFDGDRWTLAQGQNADPAWFADPELLPPPPAPPSGLTADFRATTSRGLPLVRADLGGGSLLVTAGELVWSSAQAAVVRRGAEVFAIRLYRP